MSQKPDYYTLLEVERTVTSEELKKMYRKKALEYHPDRNPGNHEAEEKFKLVAEAYEVISDPQKKQIYDQFGHAGLQGGAGGGFHSAEDIFSSFGDIFEDFFGFGGQRQGGSPNRQRRGRDAQLAVEIDFLEACFGVEKQVSVTTDVVCNTCAGSGAANGSQPNPCSYCNGYGQVQVNQGFFRISTACPQCHGQGQVIKNKCPDCRGQKKVAQKRQLKIKVPAGVESNMRLVLREEGEAGENGGRPGDLYALINVKEHEEFSRDGDDIVSHVKVLFPLLALGTTLPVNTIHGVRDIEIKAGTQSGEIFRIRGEGVANVRSGRKGDHVMMVQAVTPQKLTAQQIELMQALADELAPAKTSSSGKKKKKSFF